MSNVNSHYRLNELDKALKDLEGTRMDDAYYYFKKEAELGGPKGKEPTRYGTWESKGKEIDF